MTPIASAGATICLEICRPQPPSPAEMTRLSPEQIRTRKRASGCGSRWPYERIGIRVLSRDPDLGVFQHLFEQSVDSINLCGIGAEGQIECPRLPSFCQMMSVVSPRAFAFTNTSRGVTASASAILALPMETRTMGVGLSMINDLPDVTTRL